MLINEYYSPQRSDVINKVESYDPKGKAKHAVAII